MSNAAWAYLISRIPTLAYTIPFVTSPPGGVHEGHGGQGRPAVARATITLPPPLVDPSTGRILLEPHTRASGITVAWSSTNQGTLTRHGTLNQPLQVPIQTDTSGSVQISYTPRQERANGRGQAVKEIASLFAEVDAAQLIRETYFLDPRLGALVAVLQLARGKVRSKHPEFSISWHETDTYEVDIRNRFDVTVEVGTGGGPDLLRVRRDGKNEAMGVLYNNGDGTYRGALEAWVFSSMNGTSFVGECHDQADARQVLQVVGHLIDGGPLPPFVNVTDGTYGMQELMLYFYPASAPLGAIGPCHGTMDFTGGGPDGQPAGVFLPFNDSRWTAAINTTQWQDGIGLGVFLPETGTLDYTDNRQNGVDPNIFSQWKIVVTKQTDGP
jgi:hypothetical protein